MTASSAHHPGSPPQPSPRGWHKPVKPVALVLLVGGVLLAWLLIMAAAIWYFYGHWQAQVTMVDQPVRLRLPQGLTAMAEFDTPLRTKLNLQPVVQVPIKQTLAVQLPDQLQAHVQIDTVLPVDTSVTIDHVVPVNTTLETSIKLRSWLPAIPVSLPVTLALPVHLTVPVKADVPVKLDINASANVPPSLPVTVDEVFTVKPHIVADVRARIVSQMVFSLLTPMAPFDMRITHAELGVPFDLTFLRQRHDR